MNKNNLFISIFFLFSFSLHAQYITHNYSGNGSPGLINGNIPSARFDSPSGICRDPSGNIFIADANNNCIRKIDVNGEVTIFAGSSDSGYVDGQDTAARFFDPFDLCSDDNGNIFVSDFENQRIRMISPAGLVSTIAGSGIAGYLDGAGSVARFNYPRGIAIDHSGNIYIADSWNHRIRKIDGSTHAVTTYAGGGSNIGVGTVGGLVDGSDTTARFYTPAGLTIDGDGNLFVADAYNHRIRFINIQRVVSVLAGSGNTGPNNGGFADGAELSARFNTPTEIFYAADSSLLVGDTYNNRIRRIDNTGVVTTIAGNGIAGNINGNGAASEFNFPRGVVSNNASDSMWVSDSRNNSIRLITQSGSFVSENQISEINIFPNPCTNLIHIAGTNEQSSICIFDIAGKKIFGTISSGKFIDLNVSALTPGFYILEIAMREGIVKKCFVRSEIN